MLRRLLLPLLAFAAIAAEPTAPKGTLVIAGGGKLPPAVMQAFVEASGGKAARIAVLPTASGVPKEAAQDMVTRLKEMGVPAIVVDPRHRAEAEAAGQRDDVRACTGFWFTGGDQNRIAELVGGTSLHRLIAERHAAGAAVGGTSAGAAMMTRLMLTGEDRTGKQQLSEVGAGAYKTRDGLGFLPGCIVDQHFLRRGRHNRLLSLMMDHPDHLGLGIDEETALVVKEHRAQVVGNRFVIVFDPRDLKAEPPGFRDLRVHLLASGQGIDLRTRGLVP